MLRVMSAMQLESCSYEGWMSHVCSTSKESDHHRRARRKPLHERNPQPATKINHLLSDPRTYSIMSSCTEYQVHVAESPPPRLDNDILASTVITLPISRTETIGDHSRTSLIPNNLRIGFTGERVGGGIIWLQSSVQSIRDCVLRESYIRSRISHSEMLCCMK